MSKHTILSNNFTQGMISRKARRLYGTELLANSASSMQNVVPHTTGGFSLRPGLRFLYQLEGAEKLIPFSRSSDRYYMVHARKNNARAFCVISFTDASTPDSPESAVWDAPANDGSTVWSVDGFESVRGIRYAQTYNMMVLVEKTKRPVLFRFIENGVGITMLKLEDDTGIPDLDGEGIPLDTNKVYNYNTDGKGNILVTQGNFPSFVTFCANRLWLANSVNEAQYLWASRPFEYYNASGKSNFQRVQYYNTLDDSLSVEDTLAAISADGKQTRYYAINDVEVSISENIGVVRPDANAIPEYINGEENSNAHWKVETTVSYDANTGYTTTVKSFMEKTVLEAGYAWTHVLTNTSIKKTTESRYRCDETITADCSMHLEVGSDRQDAIAWIAVSGDIYIGTTSSEFSMDRAINATNANLSKIGSFGSDPDVQVAVGNNNIYYAETGRHGIRTVKKGYYGPEYGKLTLKCEELFSSGIVEMAWRRVPSPSLYVVLESGDVAVLCDDGSDSISAWTKWSFSKEDGTQRKIVSAAVLDTENGQDAYFLDDEGNVFLLDSSLLYDTDGTDGQIAIDAEVTGNFLDASEVASYVKSVVRYWVDSLGTPFMVGQEGNTLSTVSEEEAEEHSNDMVQIGAWSSGTNSFRWQIRNVPFKEFDILCVCAELEVS